MSPVPLLDLRAQYQSIRSEIDAAVAAVLESQQFILGPQVEQLETELATYVGALHAVGVSSGTDAILIALQALGIGAGDEVITSCYSFFATAGCITRCGARPVLVDIDPETFNLDPQRVAERVTPRTRAILPVHLFGRCAPVARLAAAAPGVPLVEDAAQAIGAEHEGRRAGVLGAVGCFSFFPSKNLGAYGDGGLVTTGDPALARQLRGLRIHGQLERGQYVHEVVGGNFRLDALQAAILRVKLRHLERWTTARRAHATEYRRLLREAGVVGERLRLPPEDAPGGRDVYNQFVIRVRDRDELRRHLAGHGVGCAVYYPLGLHQQPCFAALGHKTGDFPAAEEAARTSLALPIFPELTARQIEEVVGRVVDHLHLQAR